MANTITLTPQHPMAGVKYVNMGMIPFSVTTTETYATATGGITVDFITELANLGIPYEDVIGAIGWSTLGHLAVFTKTDTDAELTVKLWNGTTEASDGALSSVVIKGYILFSASGK